MRVALFFLCALVVMGSAWLLFADEIRELAGVGMSDDRPATGLEDSISLERGPSLEGREPTSDDPAADAAPTQPPPEEAGSTDEPFETLVAPPVRSMLAGTPPPEINLSRFDPKLPSGGVIWFVGENDDESPHPGWGNVRDDERPRGVWMYPTGRLLLQVDSTDAELAPADISIRLIHPGTRLARRFHVEGEPDGVRDRAARESLKVRVRPERLDEPFELEVARLHGLMLLVRADGHRQAWADLPVADDPDVVLSVRLTLERAVLVTGRVVDEDGSPLKPDRITAYLRVPAPSDRAELEQLAYGAGAGDGWSVVGRAPRQSILFQASLDVDADGRFRYVVQQRGDVLIHAAATGRASVRGEVLGLDRGDRDLGDLVLPPMVERYTQLRSLPHEGLFVGCDATFVATEDDWLFPEVHASVDSDGRVATTDLVLGQAYKIRCGQARSRLEQLTQADPDGGTWWFTIDDEDGDPSHHFTWDGQAELLVRAIKFR